jgi:uridine phosphorylase
MAVSHLPLTGLPRRGLARVAIVCGDPARATAVAGFLEQPELVSERREYRAWQGLFQGRPIAVCSHGVGAPGAAIAFEELIAAGARSLIRVGTCGGIQPNLGAGELVIATGAVDNTGYGRDSVPPGYPAIADLELTLALQRAARAAGQPFESGLVLSRDNFYRGVVEGADYAMLATAHVLAVEMECAALYHVAAMRQARAAAILAVDGNVSRVAESFASYQPQQPIVAAAVSAAIQIALAALSQREPERE